MDVRVSSVKLSVVFMLSLGIASILKGEATYETYLLFNYI